MNHYDFILAGGGAAGLSLAMRLMKAFPFASILILDRQPKLINDRTWCFWSEESSPFPEATFRTWEHLSFFGEGFSKLFTLAPFHYYLIRGLDFYRHAQTILQQSGQVTFEYGIIHQVGEQNGNALVCLDEGRKYSADWAFTSLYQPGNVAPQPNRYHYLKQHFRGWEIESETAIFDPTLPTLFDFRTPQNGAMRFVYILPFDQQRALIEYTLFSPSLLSDEEYDQGLRNYINDQLKIRSYRILDVENGVIPMTDQPFPRRLGERILAIGTLGGRVKPSSGYAFLRIQKDSDAIVASLKKHGHPFELPPNPARYRLFDSIMLQVMLRNGGKMSHIFTQLFQNNPVQRIFSFLNESASLTQDIRLLASLQPLPFLNAWFRLKVLKKI
ncbi:MAG: lycopene cyclase family protein [Chloroflexota bacterium]|jgi:lycopene beta-cyclase